MVPSVESTFVTTSIPSSCSFCCDIVSFGNKFFDHCSNSSDMDMMQPKLEPHKAATEKDVKNGLLVIILIDVPSALPPEREVKHHVTNISVGNNEPKNIADMHFFRS